MRKSHQFAEKHPGIKENRFLLTYANDYIVMKRELVRFSEFGGNQSESGISLNFFISFHESRVYKLVRKVSEEREKSSP